MVKKYASDMHVICIKRRTNCMVATERDLRLNWLESCEAIWLTGERTAKLYVVMSERAVYYTY